MMTRFISTCPSCYDLQPAGARYRCESCGCVLTIDRAKVQGLTADLPEPHRPLRALYRRPFTTGRGSLGG